MTKQEIGHILIHLRYGFSVFLLPVFLFAFSQALHPDIENTILAFLILHLLVYPSSNGYNSYMDNDTGSIGGIKAPPKVPGAMLPVSVFMDLISLLLCFLFLNTIVTFLVMMYIIASRAYSYRGIRLKKFPVIGFLIVTIFQGAVVYMITAFAINDPILLDSKLYFGMFLSFLMIGSGYPLTQIYQHRQDLNDGVRTLSYVLGIKGTFIFSIILIFLLSVSFCLYFWIFYQTIWQGLLFILCTLPVSIFFVSWMKKTFRNPSFADFEHTMKMNKTGSLCVNFFFISLIILKFLNY